MDCRLVQSHLDAYVDGELEPSPVIEFERHLDQCSECRNELALARMLKQGVREGIRSAEAPPSLKVRVGHALDREDAAQGRAAARWTTPLAVAAVLALALGAALRPQPGNPHATEASTAVNGPGLLSDIVAQHKDQLPADVTPDQPEKVTPWFRGRVAFRVRSVDFGEPQVRFAGARVSHVGSQRAARFYYDVGDSRMTVVAFKPPPDFHAVLRNERPSQEWRRKRVGSRVLTYRNVQGYTVPVIEHDGIAYAFTGDLDQQRLLRLVASARLP